MALSFGTVANKETGKGVLARARARAALVPDLLVEAQRISNTVASGWHGRRRRGIGDSFWQFRPYDKGESMARIDWRRTARDDAITVRDQEWEAAHTVWVWADNSPSMLYKSEAAQVSKQSRSLVLALALCDVLARSGERVGWPGVTSALSNRNAAERIAAQLVLSKGVEDSSFPPYEHMRNRSELVMISDFLDPIEDLLDRINTIARQGVRGTMVQIIDPVEERFPFFGRTEFSDPETGQKLVYGRAETLAEDYVNLFQARQATLAQATKRLGWHHIVHHTDQLASTALVAAHTRLTGDYGAAA